ncbi:TlpA disulfide reductase family protein [Hymenobacter sp. UYP22]|uniref:TlpA family protein disulfide reductase n=1 Tax=Hymenobacter sp. UYP22 TaxID=3156348 RepID=UPI0033916CA7
MKYLLLALLGALSACVTLQTASITPVETPVPSSVVVLRGTIRHAQTGDSVWLWRKLPQYNHRTKHAVAVAPDGSFLLRLPDVTAGFDAQLTHGLIVYLSPGDSLELAADRRNFNETLQFRGRGAHANNYLVQAQRQFDFDFAGLPEKQHATANPAEFVGLVDAYHQRQLDTLAAWHFRQPLPADLVQLRRQVLDLQRGLSLLRYADNLKAATKHEPELPAGYFHFLGKLPWPAEGVDACRPALLQTVASLNGAYRYFFLVNPAGQLSAAPDAAPQLHARTTADVGDNVLRDQIIGALLANQLFDFSETSRPAVQAFLPVFRAHNHDSATARNLRYAWRTTAGLQAGSSAPDFTLHDLAGKSVSLHNFRGKVVYLDFWYSSCTPCLAEAPAGARLKKQFQGRDVVFLYVSVDRKAEEWQRAVTKFNLGGASSVHLLDPAAMQAASAYGVSVYPNYWIIGRDGRVWRSAAPRPSAGAEIVALLEQALGSKPK